MAAIIGGIAAVVGAIIAFAGIMYGSRQQKKILRFQKELDAQEAAKQQEEQSKADTLEAARREMVLAQNNAERARAYRRALHADPRISRLQILDMSRPLEVTSVYVRVRVHNERVDRYVRGSIARGLRALGEQSVAPQLLGLLADKRVDKDVRGSIAGAIAGLIDKEEDVRSLATFLHGSNQDITNNIFFRALWEASRRVGVRILVRNEAGMRRLEVVRR